MKNSILDLNQIKKNSGFSLVELMVVVAIIGILASIAVPNFQRFQSRARQSEVRTNLGSFYQAAKASRAEYSFYPGNLPATGWQPEGTLRYLFISSDHSTPCSTPTAPTALPPVGGGCDDRCVQTDSTSCPLSYIPGSATSPWSNVFPGTSSSAPVSIGGGIVITVTTSSSVGAIPPSPAPFTNNNAFIVVACGNLEGLDCWSLNQSKAIENFQSGI